MVNLPNMRNLEILSLARNNIKKIGGLDEIGIKIILGQNLK
jgi:dynein light chain 1